MTQPLSPQALYTPCDPQSLPFETTDEVERLEETLGQERALDALHFGTGIRSSGFNLFVLGPNGAGKHALVRRYLEERAPSQPTPPDWCYIHNFQEPFKPKLLRLPAGWGSQLRHDLETLSEELRSAIPATFDSDEYQSRVHELQQEFNQRQEEAFQEIKQEAESKGISLMQTPSGFTFAPIREGEVLGPEEFQKLPEDERHQVEQEISELQEKLQWVLRQIPRWRKESQEKLQELNKEMVDLAVGHLIKGLKERYPKHDGVQAHLEAIQQDVLDHVDQFRAAQSGESPSAGEEAYEGILRRYQANLLVDNAETEGAPVVYADLPTHQHLIGRIEHRAQQGALLTDFHLIREGALHRANGGYLLLDVRKVLMQPFAWESLKRALSSGEVQIESLEQVYSFLSTVSLEPEPVPLDLKVVLLGDRFLYYLLAEYDPDFRELFKVQADFEEDLPRGEENHQLYARLIGTLADREGLRPMHREAVARVIEHGSRLAEDSERLTLHAGELADLLREASFWAGEAGRERVEARDVQTAIDQQVHRSDRIRERSQELIQRDIVLIDTEGETVGQVNGLAVLQLGRFAFGRPHRITATARLGDGQVIDIERETELGGPIHSKGVMILTHFLGARYAANRSLSLAASIAFEQSYGEVEGDSASAAELCALLSVLANAPLKQSMAVTGSVNQHGEIQAIGGVNEKVEGFFDICAERGLQGQGVVIPQSNVTHLMLRADVREAAERGDFAIYPARTVDEVMALLTGLEAGERDEGGAFPEGSINRRVEDRLEELSQLHSQEKGGKEESPHDRSS